MRIHRKVLPLFAAAAITLGLTGCGGDKAGVAELPAIEETVPPEPPDVAKTEGAEDALPAGGPSGTLEARRRSTISPRVSGVVTKVHVRDGDHVAEDDALVSLDPEDFALRTRQAAAAVEAARAGFSAAEADWKRSKSLLADKALAQAQFDGVNARYLGAKAQLTQAEVALAMSKKAERDATVRAPFDGVIVRRFVSEGEYASVMPATSLVTLEETGVYDLRVYLPADRAGTVKVGDAVAVRLAGASTETLGKVLQVLPPIDEHGTVAVLIEVPDKEGTLRAGMTAEAVSIRTASADGETKP